MDGNEDLATSASERESLPAHVDACATRYRILRGELRHLRRLVWVVLGVTAAGALGQLPPAAKAELLSAVGRALIGG